jgi:hypothetical protein
MLPSPDREDSTSWVAKAAARPDERELVDLTCATRGPRAEQARRDSFPPSPRPLCPALVGCRSSLGPFPRSVGESSLTALPHRSEALQAKRLPVFRARWAQHVRHARPVLPPAGRHAICRSHALGAATASVCFVAWSLACSAHHKCTSRARFRAPCIHLASLAPSRCPTGLRQSNPAGSRRPNPCAGSRRLASAGPYVRSGARSPGRPCLSRGAVNAGSLSRFGCGHPSSIRSVGNETTAPASVCFVARSVARRRT